MLSALMLKPLAGVRIAVTRAESRATELSEPLQRAGARVLLCPLIRIEAQPFDVNTRALLSCLPEFDWIVFTSVNGVEQFVRAVTALDIKRTDLQSQQVACVGPSTAAAAERYGFRPNLMPAEFVGDAVAAALLETADVSGKKILLPRAEGGGQALPTALRERGADVYDLTLYRSVIHTEGAGLLRQAVAKGEIDLVTFTSGSTVAYFVDTLGTTHDILVAVIGPSTAAVADRHGLRVDIEANPHTSAGLVAAILEYYAAGGRPPEVLNAGK